MVMVEKSTVSTWPVRNCSTRSWSAMRCSRSPVCLVSKKGMGRLSSLAKKSDSMLRLTLMLTCVSSQRRTKSRAVALNVSMSWPASTSHTKPMSRRAMPLSTTAWVSRGSSSCMALPMANPASTWAKAAL